MKISSLKRIGTPPLVLALTCGPLGCGHPKEAGEAGQSKPNIVYILADDLGYGQLGCYGQKKIKTPHIDALAARGMIFTHHYAGAPLSSPSRCVLMTGLHSGHAQIRANDEREERGDVWDYVLTQEHPELEGQYPLREGTPTIASLLKTAGYKTGIVGKWGLGGPLTEGTPWNQGFDFFFGHNCQRQAWNYYPRYLWKDSVKVGLPNELIIPGTSNCKTKLPPGADPYSEASYAGFTQKAYAPDAMQKEAIRFIRENKSQPFFLCYATPIPHTALQAPQKWIDYYREIFGDEEPYLGEKNYFPVRYPHATFAAMVSCLDEQVGELVEVLKETGVYDHTLIIFTSDNGPANAGGTDSPWFDSARPFRCGPGWGKGTLREGGIRVPMIAHWPGKIKAGSRTSHLSAFWDVLPTFCEIAGTGNSVQTDGISFLPTLLGDREQPEHSFLYWEYPGSDGQQAVRMGKWKGLRKNIRDGNFRLELYDVETDNSETIDLAGYHPEIVARMEEILLQEHIPAENLRFRMKIPGD
jgi:arylsulfatase